MAPPAVRTVSCRPFVLSVHRSVDAVCDAATVYRKASVPSLRTVIVRSRKSPGIRSVRLTMAVAPRSVERARVGVGVGDGVGVGAGVADGGTLGVGVVGGALAGGRLLEGVGEALGAGAIVVPGAGGALGRAAGAAEGAGETGAAGWSADGGDTVADGGAAGAARGAGGAGSKSWGATSWIAEAMPPRNGIRATFTASPSFCPTNARIARRPSR